MFPEKPVTTLVLDFYQITVQGGFVSLLLLEKAFTQLSLQYCRALNEA